MESNCKWIRSEGGDVTKSNVIMIKDNGGGDRAIVTDVHAV